MNNGIPSVGERLLHHFSSVAVDSDCSLTAASLGQGVFRSQGTEGEWESFDRGLPEGVTVNRLQTVGGELYACTNKGLYICEERLWQQTEIAVPCYRMKLEGSYYYTATQYGLWCNSPDGWIKMDVAGETVFDFIHSPHFLVMGTEAGIVVYDWYSSSRSEFEFRGGVTSLAVVQGFVVGTTGTGELIVGNRRGAFHTVTFGRNFYFSVMAVGGDVYVCSERGLYRMIGMKDNVHLLSVKLGYPVTDVALRGNKLLMSTLFHGIQTL